MKKIDIAIIGAGPAGLTAGIYLGRARLNAVVFEKAMAGGQMNIAEHIENYPGFEKGISGAELAAIMHKQAVGCGAQFVEDEIEHIKPAGSSFIISCSGGNEYEVLAVIVATGANPRKLGVAGEEKFTGRGVSYCATCDAPLFKDKTVVVVGGGDTAAQEALFLAKHCSKVYLVHRRDRLRAAKILAERIAACKKIEPVWNAVITEIKGDKKVTGVVINDVGAGLVPALIGRPQGPPLHQITCDGVFVFAGIVPCSDIIKEIVKVDKDLRIITDDNMKTSREGIFACGDVRKKTLWQIVTACGDAATAAISAQHYVEEVKGTAY